jgi:hypothetical protein
VTIPNPPQSGPGEPQEYPGYQGQPGGYPSQQGYQGEQGYPGQAPGQPGQPGQPGYPGGPQGYPGQPQGFPGQPQGYPGVPGQPPAPPAKRRRPRTRLLISIGVVVVIVIIGIVGRILSNDPDKAAVGDCMSGTTAENLKVVKCTDANAQYKVVGKVNGKSQTEFNTNSREICGPFQGAESAFWKGERGGDGYILCLAPNK